MSKRSFDVAIIGAGIAGCHLAQLLVKRDISVVLIDQCPLETSGPHWINAVPEWMFLEADLAPPEGKELFDKNDRFIVRAPHHEIRVVVDNLGIFDVDMKLLGDRLKRNFISHKKAHFIKATIAGGDFDKQGRLELIYGKRDSENIVVQAQLFVDGAGIKSALRSHHPQAGSQWKKIERNETCTAAQGLFVIKDRHGAQTYLENNQTRPTDILSDVGFMGGYSLLRSQIREDFSHISLLCGVRALPNFHSAHVVISKFVKDNSWIGTRLIDGRGAIPLNAPYPQLIAPGFALLGDAACQVYAAHGSGIGIGLIAARYLANAIIEAHNRDQDIGSTSALSLYPEQFHKKYYKRLFFSQQFRKFSQSLNPHQISTLLGSGLLNAELIRQTLRQEDPGLSFSSLKTLLTGALKSPTSFMAMLPVFGDAITGDIKARQFSRTSR